MKEKGTRNGGERSSRLGERSRTMIRWIFCCGRTDQEKNEKEKEGERSSFLKDHSSAPTETMTDVSSGSVPSLPPHHPRPILRPKLMRQSSRSESCLQNVWSRGCRGSPAPPGSSLPPHMRALGGSTASLRRERGGRGGGGGLTRSCDVFRSGSLARSSLKVREETDVMANIRKRELVSEIQGRKGSQRWKGQPEVEGGRWKGSQRWKGKQHQEKEKKSGGGESKEGSPRVRLQRMVRASLRYFSLSEV